MFVVIINIFEMYNTKSYAVPQSKPEYEGLYDTNEGHLSNSGMQDVSNIPGAFRPSNNSDSASFDKKVSIIASVVRTVGILVSVGTLMVIGIKFMLGSVEEKAQYKQTIMPWIIGAILIFAMTSLPALIYDMSTGALS